VIRALVARRERTFRKALKKLVDLSKSLALIFWNFLGITWRFWRWRLDLWHHPEQLMESTHNCMKQTLLFIRHGQTTWNVEHLLPGQLPDVPLTETGRAQAARLAEALHVLPITTIISSPLERAQDTAAYLARSRDVSVQLDDALMDTNIGHWAGQKYDELLKSDPAWKEYVRDPKIAPAGVETFPQVQQRVLAAVEHWRQQEASSPYLAFVAHADVVKLLLAHYMELDVARAGLLSIDNASVSMVELEPEQRPRVVAIGWNPQPGWLKPPLDPHQPVDPTAQAEASQAGPTNGAA
jgi:broad specificity phosphatase PhoE